MTEGKASSEEFVMMFLAESRNTGDPAPYLEAELARVVELQQEGTLELVLLKADQSGAILLLNAADLAAARTAVDSLPLVANGITSCDFTEVATLDSLLGAPAPQSYS